MNQLEPKLINDLFFEITHYNTLGGSLSNKVKNRVSTTRFIAMQNPSEFQTILIDCGVGYSE